MREVMKKRIWLPMCTYMIATFLFALLAECVLESIMWHDVTDYIDGRTVYRLGIGTFTQLIILLGLIFVIKWIGKTATKFLTGKAGVRYRVISIVLCLCTYVCWAYYFGQRYTIGFIYWLKST